MCLEVPKLILLFSGKRKSGKDTVTDILYERVKDVAVNIKLSAPIKSHFANSQGLDFDQLMGTGDYKEQYRLEMIKWSEDIRNSDNGYFCRAAVDMSGAMKKPVWIVTDMRRRTDLQWFRENYKNIVTVRVSSTEDERQKRGWVFTSGIDDQETECDLDTIKEWDVVIENNGTLCDLQPMIDQLVERINLAAQNS
ncbi:phosphomevalonate kinase isoform X2 [Macrosteles quadrilineatus]|uniref:phosphomevalonate kinase isoform X2 n=1 Tax=Macrosteles quadrilineatus TaxID=74068 RepID=UPI0023E1B92A|nr:phosphomevalonate kinase isoform X2 [Macrosteles quadrilineatus]